MSRATRRRGLVAVGLSLIGLTGLSCATAQAPSAPARLRIELARGLPAAPIEVAASSSSMHVVLDLTPSLATSAAEGTSPRAAARVAAVRLLRALPPEQPVTLHLLGIASGASCTPPIPVAAPRDADSPAELAKLADFLDGSSESSLADALDEVSGAIQAEGASSPGARVVVISDLAQDCGADLCASASGLASLGAEIDFVVVGDAEPPACLAALDTGTPAWLPSAPAEPVPVRVERQVRTSQDGPGATREFGQALTVVAQGTASGEAFEVPPGPGQVTVGLEPVERIGPLDLAAGTETRVRILDFPALDPPVRRVFVGTVAAPALRTGGAPGLRTGGAPGLRTGGAPGLRTGGAPGLRTGGAPGLRTGGAPVSTTGGAPVSTTGGGPVSTTGGGPVSTTVGAPVSSPAAGEVD